MIGRVEMRPVMGGELDVLHRPAFTVGQVFLPQAWEERKNLRDALLVIHVRDLGTAAGRIGSNIILKRHRKVDQLAWHG